MTRKPAAFRLDDPQVIVADDEARAVRGTVRIVPQPENFDLPAVIPSAVPVKRRFPWGEEPPGAARAGLAKKKPWSRSQPIRLRTSPSSRRSTPSAMTCLPRS